MKKSAMRVIRERELEVSKNIFTNGLIEYHINGIDSSIEQINAHGYLISREGYLVFFIRNGDELLECARFRNWNSVKLVLKK